MTTEHDLHFRISELERKLEYLYEHFSLEEPPAAEGLPADVQQAMMAGNKIGAVKLLHERTGMGLAEAKAAVEAEGALPRIIE
jgi:ribosomal protein L7/L12